MPADDPNMFTINRDIGRLEGRVGALEGAVSEIKGWLGKISLQVSEIHDIISSTKGTEHGKRSALNQIGRIVTWATGIAGVILTAYVTAKYTGKQ